MYTKWIYSPVQLFRWTRLHTASFLIISAVPVVLHDTLGMEWLELPWLPIALVGTAVAFILGFQNNASYDRLWEARKIWGAIVNTSRSWAIGVLDQVNDQTASEEIDAARLKEVHRRLILRHVAWLTALRHMLRQPREWEHFSEEWTNQDWIRNIGVREHKLTLEDELQGTLSDEERAFVLSKRNPAAHLVSLQSKELRRLRKRGLIDDFRHLRLQNLLDLLYEHQGMSERIKNFPYPRQYATLNSVFTWVFILLVPFGVLCEFDSIGQGLVKDGYPAGDRFVWLTIPFSTLVMWIFHTLERIGRLSESPFEGSSNDVPITTISRAIEIDLREMLEDDPEAIPKVLEPVSGYLT